MEGVAVKNYKLARAIDESGYNQITLCIELFDRYDIELERKAIMRYVNKSTFPKANIAIGIARILGKTVEELWGGCKRCLIALHRL